MLELNIETFMRRHLDNREQGRYSRSGGMRIATTGFRLSVEHLGQMLAWRARLAPVTSHSGSYTTLISVHLSNSILSSASL